MAVHRLRGLIAKASNRQLNEVRRRRQKAIKRQITACLVRSFVRSTDEPDLIPSGRPAGQGRRDSARS